MLDFPQLRHPIIQAPMGGGPSTPALAAAVSHAGGLGFLAAGYKTPNGLQAEIAALRRLTTVPEVVPFAVELGGGGPGGVTLRRRG